MTLFAELCWIPVQIWVHMLICWQSLRIWDSFLIVCVPEENNFLVYFPNSDFFSNTVIQHFTARKLHSTFPSWCDWLRQNKYVLVLMVFRAEMFIKVIYPNCCTLYSSLVPSGKSVGSVIYDIGGSVRYFRSQLYIQSHFKHWSSADLVIIMMLLHIRRITSTVVGSHSIVWGLLFAEIYWRLE